MNLFTKKPSIQEQSKQWQRDLKRQMRQIERDVRKIEMEEKKVEAQVKKYAKKNQMKAVKTLAKSLVQSRNQRERLMVARANINSVVLQISEQQATLKVTGAMKQSASIMKSMQKLVSVPKLAQTASAMQREMMKAGLIQEMIEDTFESMEEEDVDMEADTEVDKVLAEILQGQFANVGAVSHKAPAVPVEDEEEDKDLEEMKQRLANLSRA